MSATHESEELVGRRIALISVSVGIVLSVLKVVIGTRPVRRPWFQTALKPPGMFSHPRSFTAGCGLPASLPMPSILMGTAATRPLPDWLSAQCCCFREPRFLHGITSSGPAIEIRSYALYPLLAAVVAKVALASAKFRIGGKIDSSALQADAWHDLTDLLSTSVAFMAVVLTLINRRFSFADRAGAIVIGMLILFLSVQVVRRTVDSLLDTMPEPRRLNEIRQVALTVRGAHGIEKCYARRTGLKYHVDLHLEVDPNMSVRESHEIATRVKKLIKHDLPWVADVLVHVEPSGMAARLVPPAF